MKKTTLSLFALVLAGCATTSDSKDVSLDYLLTNPLFAERYADEMVDVLVEFKIQEDPILEDKKKADLVEQKRSKWLEVARNATKNQRDGYIGNYIIHKAQGRGEFLYLQDVLFVDSVFNVTPGPNLQMYMTTEVDPRDVEFPDETAIHLGDLKTPYGAHNYNVPAQEDTKAYRTVVIWDADLEQIWGFAQLR